MSEKNANDGAPADRPAPQLLPPGHVAVPVGTVRYAVARLDKALASEGLTTVGAKQLSRVHDSLAALLPKDGDA